MAITQQGGYTSYTGADSPTGGDFHVPDGMSPQDAFARAGHMGFTPSSQPAPTPLSLDQQFERDTGVAMPTFNSNLDPSGNLKNNFKLNAQAPVQFSGISGDVSNHIAGISDLNKDPLHALESYGMGTGDSPWAQAQLEALKQATGQSMGAAKTNATTSNAAALDAAAARGGVGSNTLENAVRNATNNSTMAGQGVIGNNLTQQGQIRSTDEGNRLNTLSQLPGMEVQSLQPEFQKESAWQAAATADQAQKQQLEEQQQQYQTGVDQYNIQNIMQGTAAQDQFNVDKYKNQLAYKAGQEQSAAQSNSGKK